MGKELGAMTTKDKVLHLLKKTPDFLSGEKLAQQLEVSRTSIWKAIKELEKAGYRFEHGPTGYRYLPSDVLDAKEIQQELRSFIPDLKVQTMLTSESTMKDAKLAAAQGDSVSKLFVADTQEQAGRGIYMSLLLHPDKRFDELPQYTIIAASACVKAIESVTGRSASIKWVNDIYMDGKKVCGILSEAVSDMESGRISHIIIGIGLNFSVPQNHFPADLQEKAISVFPDGQASVTRNQLISKIWQELFTYLSHPEKALDFYKEKSFVLGKTVSVNQKGTTYVGLAKEIGDHGELIVQTNEQEMSLSSGEISLTSIRTQ